VQQLFANRVSGFFGLDVLVSAIVLFIFVREEGRRRHAATVGPDRLHATGRRLAWPPAVSVSKRTRAGVSTASSRDARVTL
jgi:hypothetical protein